MADYDPRLVDLYDVDNPDGPDHDYYRALADEIGARAILDIGCGTGMLTASFALADRMVVGIDPSAAMLAFAAVRPGGSSVQWINGDSCDIPSVCFDYAVMTGNVAQHIPADEWPRTLSDIARALRPGGVLAFESRNPRARAWEAWSEGEPTSRLTPRGPLREWAQVSEPEPGQVLLTSYNVFEETGEDIVVTQTLAFRDRVLIESQLRDAGFVVDAVWGGWDRCPCRDGSPVMVFETHRT